MPLELEFDWCAPVSGDGHQLGLPTWERPPTLDYAVSVFEAAARGGYRYLLIGMGFNNHVLEAWTLATAVLARTRDVGAIVAVRPGFFSAAQTAKMAATLDTISDGRLALNIVSGGRPREQAKYGDRLDHDARYRRTAEFMDVCRRLWTATESFDYRGDYYELAQTRLDALPLTPGGPPFYFGGASGAAESVGADHADVHLFWGETLAQTRERLRRMAFLVAQVGRAGQVRFGVRINVIARATNAEARAAADFLIAPIDPERIHKAKQRDLDKVLRDSVGQKRQWELLARTDDDLYVEPLLWAGISVARSGAGMAIVGSYDEVAGRLFEYVELGVSVFILSGYPHLEECERVAEHVIPRVHALLAAQPPSGVMTRLRGPPALSVAEQVAAQHRRRAAAVVLGGGRAEVALLIPRLARRRRFDGLPRTLFALGEHAGRLPEERPRAQLESLHRTRSAVLRDRRVRVAGSSRALCPRRARRAASAALPRGPRGAALACGPRGAAHSCAPCGPALAGSPSGFGVGGVSAGEGEGGGEQRKGEKMARGHAPFVGIRRATEGASGSREKTIIPIARAGTGRPTRRRTDPAYRREPVRIANRIPASAVSPRPGSS